MIETLKLIDKTMQKRDVYNADWLMEKKLTYRGIFIIDKVPEIGLSMGFNVTPTYTTRKPIHFRSHYQAYIFNAYRFFYWMQHFWERYSS